MSKPFDELTDEELKELEERDWTSEQITHAISLALKDGAMEAVAQLLHRLARVDPRKAGFLLDAIRYTGEQP